ncbi:MAG: hypothetical protein H6752_17935 [Candidatus Omnitrophica bacterium]|nr:hypothetical protein [Candidatus Omnitrophota bacterium]
MMRLFTVTATLLILLPLGAIAQEAPTQGLAKPGSAIAVVDFFNLTDNPQYDPWERLLGRGLRRGLHVYKTHHRIDIEVIPHPRIHKALEELGIDTHYIAPEQARAIGERLQSDLVVLGSFNVVEGVVASSIKIIDDHSGKLLHEETRFGTEEKISEFVQDLSETLNELLLKGLEGTSVSTQSSPPIVPAPDPDVEATTEPFPVPVPEPETVESEGILEPVDAESADRPMTQVAGPGGGAPPPSRGIMPPPTEIVETEVVEQPSEPMPPPPAPIPQPTSPPVQQMLNQTWQRSQGPPQQSPASPPTGYASPPAASPPTAMQQPYAPQQMTAPQGPPQQPMMMANPNALPPRAPVTTEPIESMIPRLPPQQQRPSEAVNAPFKPMPAPAQPPPPPGQLGYPMVPPMQQNPYAQGYPQQQPQERPGPVRRFFGWVGRGLGFGQEPATQPVAPNQYQQPGYPQQQGYPQGQYPQQQIPFAPQQQGGQ